MSSTKQKAWVNSMFSQFSHLESSNSLKRKKHKESQSPPAKRVTRNKTNGVRTAEDVIDQEVKSEGSADLISKVENFQILKESNEPGVQILNKNWIDLFAPTTSMELAIHPKKIKEIQQWFQHCYAMKHKDPAQLCLLTGPSGCGKTAAVRVLAKERNIIIQEWINPVDHELIYGLGDQTNGQSLFIPQVDAFKNFLFKASRYRSLLNPNTINPNLLMVEDFPNFLLRDSTVFQDILEDYVSYAKSPLIFIVTDAKTRGLNISYNIFTDHIREKFHINHININAVASTIMQKSMKRFCSIMRSPTYCQIYKSPPQDIIDSVSISAQGDIRNALLNLHFCSLRIPNLLVPPKVTVNRKKSSRKPNSEFKLKSLGRDESITMMHALGRVFNPKFTEHKRLLHSPEQIAEAFSTEPKKFIDLVEANYIVHFPDIEYLLEATDGLSICDVILNEYRDDSLALTGLNIGIRSVMVANTNPVTGWMPIKGHKRIDLDRPKTLSEAFKALPEYNNISSNLYTLDYKTFVDIISPKTSSRNKN